MTSCLESDKQESIPSELQLKWIVGFLLLYFALRLVFYAVTISDFVPPDEVTHMGLCRIFSQVLLLPENSPETYRYGLVTNVPWLYYWVMGKLLLLNLFGMSDLLFLRLINIPLAFGTVYFVWRTLRLLTIDPLPQILLIVAMTNTSMFTFLSASVSYDNLTNLLAAMSVYYLMSFFQNRSPHLLAGSLLCQLAGCMTKSSFLPLVLVLNLLLVVHEFRNIRAFGPAMTAYLHDRSRRSIALLLAISFFMLLNLHLYGGNLLGYKKIAPEMSAVLSPEIAMQYRISARDTIFTLFKEQSISYDQALLMASYIEHPGDQGAVVYLVRNYLQYLYSGANLMGPFSYIVPWGKQMLSSVFGISGHLAMFNEWPTILPVVILMLLTALAVLIRCRPKRDGLLPSFLGIISALYGIFLMYGVNYRIYVYFASFPIALQGRYIFPVIGPLYVFSCFYLLRLFNGKYARFSITAAAALVLIASDFPFFLTHATPGWFSMPLK